jgi:hypothetical protein
MNIAKRPVPRYDFKALGETIKTALTSPSSLIDIPEVYKNFEL